MFKAVLLFDALLFAVVLWVLCPSPAHAYFDLGIGTYMLQLFFAFGAAFWFSFKNTIFGKGKANKASKSDVELETRKDDAASETKKDNETD